MRAEDATPTVLAKELQLAPIQFLPANSGVSYVVEQGGLGRLCVTKGAAYFVATLPIDGTAVVERITARIKDRNREGFGMMSLARRALDSFEVLGMTPLSIGTGDGEDEVESLTTASFAPPTIPGHGGTYVLQLVLTSPGVCLYGANVAYHLP